MASAGLATIGNVQLLTKLQMSSTQVEDQQPASHDIYIARLRDVSSSDVVGGGADALSSHSSASASGGSAAATFVVARIFPLEVLAADERLRLKLERHQLVLRAANHRHILRAWPSVYTATDLVTLEEFCEFGEVFEVVEKNNEDAYMRSLEDAATASSGGVMVGSSSAAAVASHDPDKFSPDGLPVAVVLRLFDELLQAVAHCHDVLGVCHRDIKLEHLLLDRNMSLKLTSFGMAAALPEKKHKESSSLQQSLAATSANSFAHSSKSAGVQSDAGLLHVACGSRHYVAPEILAGKAYDGTLADVWSCGIVLYALVTGGFPLNDNDTTIDDVPPSDAVMTLSTLSQLQSFQRIRDVTVKDIVRGMLSPDPAKRWTITQVQQLWSRLRRARRTDHSQQNQFRY
jgi:serine/threonine protein kinase